MMGTWLRKARGLLGFGVTWGALWAGIGAAVGGVLGMMAPEYWAWSNPVLDMAVEWAIGFGLYGFVSGVGFAAFLSLGEGRKTLFDLKLGRVALWGVLGSALVPLAFLWAFESGTSIGEILGAIATTGALGGTFAPASVAIARRAALQAGEHPGLLGSDHAGTPALSGDVDSEDSL